ncbi:MAG: hypothetical protein SFU27_11675 [Thermonemataceae bacterium]|nr:hypothetical protein [Thermonemataceae bacterium]
MHYLLALILITLASFSQIGKIENSVKPDAVGNFKFSSFEFGDAEHYYFTDTQGKTWEFGRNESKMDFAVEANGTFIANKKLVGKRFSLTYSFKKLPQYQDGPIVDVLVITNAKQL